MVITTLQSPGGAGWFIFLDPMTRAQVRLCMCSMSDHLQIRNSSFLPRSWDLVLLFQSCQNPFSLSIPNAPVQQELVWQLHSTTPFHPSQYAAPSCFGSILKYCPVSAGLGISKREIEKGINGYTEEKLEEGAVEIGGGRKPWTHTGVSSLLLWLI